MRIPIYRTNEGIPTSGAVVGQDILRGAQAISGFLFGESCARRVYYLVERRGLPVFRLGSMICARRSVLTQWIELQEATATTLGAEEVAR